MLDWIGRAILIASMLSIASCEIKHRDLNEAELQSASSLLRNANDAARRCLDDAFHVLPEHSGNCVETARYLKSFKLIPKCNEGPTAQPRCQSIISGWHEVRDLHWRAIGIGLARNHVESGYEFYQDPEALLIELKRCGSVSKKSGADCVPKGDNGWPKTL